MSRKTHPAPHASHKARALPAAKKRRGSVFAGRPTQPLGNMMWVIFS